MSILNNNESMKAVWNKKKALRTVYQSWYCMIKACCMRERVLEIGGGIGNFKEFWPELYSTDIVASPWIDEVADAHQLPFDDNAFDGAVGVDVLHHLANIDNILQELRRCVKSSGRLVFVEPYDSPVSHLIRRLFHHEAVDTRHENPHGQDKTPELANDAMPTKVFVKEAELVSSRFKGIRLLETRLFDKFVYPLTGGFNYSSLLPQSVLMSLYKLEKPLRFLNRFMAFKMLIVLEVEK